jgi:predicted GNAT family N-acyltransferase
VTASQTAAEASAALRIESVTDATVADWRLVHNQVIPTAPLSEPDVRERLGRHLLTVAHAGTVLVGCATVRRPDEAGTATVIARVLPEHRRRGLGEAIYLHSMRVARNLGPASIETVVLASNHDGVRFALTHGFAEVGRDLPPGAVDAFITLRLHRQ